jgi:probable rRNA maturation factor
LASPEKMRELNIQWRDEDRAASILSFPQGKSPGPQRVLGDLAIKSDVIPFPDYLLCHGLLHLLGYKHDTDAQYEKMEKKQKQLMDILGKNKPKRD